MKIILMGKPGVGKGTYAKRLKDIYGLPHIASGDLFREAYEKGTEVGVMAKEKYWGKGELVPDDITIRIVEERLKQPDCEKGFILDGFPRTIAQAEALERITDIDKVINFYADDSVLIQRISGRRICRKCRAIFHIKNIIPKVEGICDKCGGELYQREDEKPDIVKERLKEYGKKTKPLIDFYREKGLLAEIDGSIDVNDPNFHVIDDCRKVLDQIQKTQQGE